MGENIIGQLTRLSEPKTGRKERTKKTESTIEAEAKSLPAANCPKRNTGGNSMKATIDTNANTKENCESGGEIRTICESDRNVNSAQASERHDQPTTDIISTFKETNGRQRSSENRQKPTRKKPAPTSKAPVNGAAKATRSREKRQLASSSFNSAVSSNESNSITTNHKLHDVSGVQSDPKCAIDSHFHVPSLEPECEFALFKPNSQVQNNDDDPSTHLDDYQAYYNRNRRELYYQMPGGAARDHQVYNMSRHAHNSEDNYHNFREENDQESVLRNGKFKEKQQSQIHSRFDYNERIISSPKDQRSFQRILSDNQLVDHNYEMSNVDRNYAMRGDEQEFMNPIENYQYKSSDESPQSQMKHSYYSSDQLFSPEYYHASNFPKDQQTELRYRRLSSSMVEGGSPNAKKHKYMAQDHTQFAIGYSNRHQSDSLLNLNLADGAETKSSGKLVVKNGSGDDSPIAFNYRKNSLPHSQSSPQMPESSILLNKGGNYGNMPISGDVYSRQRESSQTVGFSDPIIYGCEQPLPQTNYHYYPQQTGASNQNFAKFSQDVVINDGIFSLSDLGNQRDMIYVDSGFSPSTVGLSKQPVRNSINNLDGLHNRPLMSVDKASRGDDQSPNSTYVKFNTSGDSARTSSSNIEPQQKQRHPQHRELDKKLASTKLKSRNDPKASSNSNDIKMDEAKRKQLRRANNRAAAAKCRQKKNDTITNLNDANEKLKLINSQMSRALTVCTSQRNYLLEQIKNQCGCEALQMNPQIQELIEMTLNVENGLDFGHDYRMVGFVTPTGPPEMDQEHFESRASNITSNRNASTQRKLPTTIDYFANEDDILPSARVNSSGINSNEMSAAMMQRERNQIELMNQNKALQGSGEKMKHVMPNSASKCDNNVFRANERPAPSISPPNSGRQISPSVDQLQAQNLQASIRRPSTDGDKITPDAIQSNNMQSPGTHPTMADSKDISDPKSLVDGQGQARRSPHRLQLNCNSPADTSMTLNNFQLDGFGSSLQNRSANVDRDAPTELRASPPPQLSIN